MKSIKLLGTYNGAVIKTKVNGMYVNDIEATKVSNSYSQGAVILTTSMTLSPAYSNAQFVYSGSSDIYLKIPNSMDKSLINISVKQLGAGSVGIISA